MRFLIGFLLLCPVTLIAQHKVTFKVSNQKTIYSILPADSVLWAHQPTKILLSIKGRKKDFHLTLINGTVTAKDNIYYLKVDSGVKTMLTVLEKLPNGKNKVAFSKTYTVKYIADPVAYVCGIKSDSIIDKEQLLRDDIIYAYSSYYKTRLKVLSFNFIYVAGERVDTLFTRGCHFNLVMRREINKLVPGNVVFFNKIQCQLPNGNIKELRPVTLYINDTKRYRVGY
ncbi:MAG TPA: GldM family protein [Bacteroidia bacterium]|nr:GldM family protein [Bacteroidia bacterium]